MSDSSFAVPISAPKDKPTPPPLKYEKPSWSSMPIYDYTIEVLKNGSSIETLKPPKKEFITIGRLPFCDVLMEHPSISRYHAVIQFNKEGEAYLYDLDSAHGTKVNKKTISGRDYVILKPGDQLRFGESTRICIFESEKPYDPEAELEAKRQYALQRKIAAAKSEAIGVENEEGQENQGVSWGFAEDAVEEEEEEEEEEDKELSAKDIEDGLNESGDAMLLNIEATKMAIEDAKRRREDLKIMYGDDSDEELYDKTSRKKTKKVDKAETHDELVVKQKIAQAEIEKIEKEIKDLMDAEKEKKKEEEEEDLDSFMNNLSKKPIGNGKSLFVLKKELSQLKKDNDRLIKLVKLTKPSHIL